MQSKQARCVAELEQNLSNSMKGHWNLMSRGLQEAADMAEKEVSKTVRMYNREEKLSR